MARFYDTINDSDLDRVLNILKSGGIEYSLRLLGDNQSIKEIDVAEEDQAYAELLLNSPAHPRN